MLCWRIWWGKAQPPVAELPALERTKTHHTRPCAGFSFGDGNQPTFGLVLCDRKIDGCWGGIQPGIHAGIHEIRHFLDWLTSEVNKGVNTGTAVLDWLPKGRLPSRLPRKPRHSDWYAKMRYASRYARESWCAATWCASRCAGKAAFVEVLGRLPEVLGGCRKFFRHPQHFIARRGYTSTSENLSSGAVRKAQVRKQVRTENGICWRRFTPQPPP